LAVKRKSKKRLPVRQASKRLTDTKKIDAEIRRLRGQIKKLRAQKKASKAPRSKLARLVKSKKVPRIRKVARTRLVKAHKVKKIKKVKLVSGGTRVIPRGSKSKRKLRSKQKRRSKKSISKTSSSGFRVRTIETENGSLIRIIKPISQKDFNDKFKKLKKDKKFQAFKKKFGALTYTVYGHEGRFTFQDLDQMSEFFKVAYAPLNSGTRKQKNHFYAHLEIFASDYKTARKRVNKAAKIKKKRNANRTGR
jgi:hypothetical protein